MLEERPRIERMQMPRQVPMARQFEIARTFQDVERLDRESVVNMFYNCMCLWSGQEAVYKQMIENGGLPSARN